jgi:hypothetical protein
VQYSRTGEAYGQDDPQGLSLAGAEFTVRYWDGYYDTVKDAEASGAPTRTWVFGTVAGGGIFFFRPSGYVLVSGDPLYFASSGSPTIPLGTVAIQETKAPDGYLLPSLNPVSVQQIKLTGEHLNPVTRLNAVTVLEQPHEARVLKRDANTKDLIPNAEFTLYKQDDAGGWVFFSTHLTDITGTAIFSPVPVGTYKMVETRPAPGYQYPEQEGILAEQIFVVTDTTDTIELVFDDSPLTTVEVLKKSDDGKPVADTLFRIYAYPLPIVDGFVQGDVLAIKLDDPLWVPVAGCLGRDTFGNTVRYDSGGLSDGGASGQSGFDGAVDASGQSGFGGAVDASSQSGFGGAVDASGALEPLQDTLLTDIDGK